MTIDSPARPPSKAVVWVATALAIVALWAFAFPALDRYNVTWDEALGDFFFGERYLSFFTSFDPAYLDFAADPYPPDRRPDLGLSPFRNRPWEYYPFANTLAAATSATLSRALGWLDPFDGFHALSLLLAGLLIAVLVPFVARRWGLVAALAAAGLLFGAPRVFAHLMANIKDFPLMALYSLTLLAFLAAYERGSARGLVASGALFGLTLATKANALFLPAIPAGVVLLDLARGTLPAAWAGRRRRRLLLLLIVAGALGVAIMVAVWPYLWADPIGRFGEHLRYIGLRKGATRPESMAPVLEAIVLTTPPLFLALAAFGLVPALARARRGDRLARLVLLWLPVPLLRYLLPAAVNFDGVRHFLEIFPALALLAGLGAATAIAALVRRLPLSPPARAAIKAAVLALVLLPGTLAVLRSHPFQLAYWNAFAGGLEGARAAGAPQAGDYWGTSYRLGLEWLNENAPPGALLAVPVIEHAVRLVAGERLRDDIVLLPITTPFAPRIAPERMAALRADSRRLPLYVMFVPRRDWLNELMRECLTRLEPEAVWALDGEPVLLIYRYREGP